MTSETEISTIVAIEKVGTVPGRDGPQWELQVKWPWSTKIPDKIWLDKKVFTTEPVLGSWPVVVEKRGLKRKADGTEYDGSHGWMFNYRVIRFGKSEQPETPPREDTPPWEEPPAQKRSAAPEIPPNPAALGACQNHAVSFITSGIIPLPEGRDLDNFIRELRDRFYRNINQQPLAPLHYCYVHDAERQQSSKSGKWGHVREDKTACLEHTES